MMKAEKIAEKICDVFTDVEFHDKEVGEIILPLNYLKIIEKEEPSINCFFASDLVCSVNVIWTDTEIYKTIWGARVKIGKRIKCIAKENK